MKVIGINGSPRNNWNTATLLAKALEGAASQGAETELFHLYDLDFKGCISCFACKTVGGLSYGRCNHADGLLPILRMIEDADAVILASPIYFGGVTGEMKSFLERLMYPYLAYTTVPRSLIPRKVNVGCIYTMNATEEMFGQLGYDRYIGQQKMLLKLYLRGKVENLCCFDTYQFEDYSKVLAESFDPLKKAERRANVFPEDCKAAFELGKKMAASN